MSKIIIYSTPSCMACRSTQNQFSKQNIDVVKVDLSQDQVSFDRLVSMGYSAAPIVEIIDGDQVVDIWSGFRPDKISQFSN